MSFESESAVLLTESVGLVVCDPCSAQAIKNAVNTKMKLSIERFIYFSFSSVSKDAATWLNLTYLVIYYKNDCLV